MPRRLRALVRVSPASPSIGPEAVRSFLALKSAQGRAPSTLRDYAKALRLFFRFAGDVPPVEDELRDHALLRPAHCVKWRGGKATGIAEWTYAKPFQHGNVAIWLVTPGGVAMVSYVPVLKGKGGEFKAWREASPEVRAHARPVFEVIPNTKVENDLKTFLRGLAPGLEPGDAVTIDCGYVDRIRVIERGLRTVEWIGRELHTRGRRVIPVVRLGDDPQVRRDAASVAALHGAGVCLRLGSENADPDGASAAKTFPGLLRDLGVPIEQVHLLVDMWEVDSDKSVGRAATVANTVLAWAQTVGPWQRITLLSGAFPASISSFPVGQATNVQRLDAALYERVAGAWPGMTIDFGDFGITHPAVAPSVKHPALPNLRYANTNKWLVLREKAVLPGNESFFTICGRLVASNAWAGAQYSWGDSEIERCSRSDGGAGAGREWRAYGTSHHIATVVDRLTNLGAP